MKELRELEKAATPGPWTVDDWAAVWAPPDLNVADFGEGAAAPLDHTNAKLTVALRNVAPLLLDVVEQGQIVAKYGRITHEFLAALAALDAAQ